MATLPWYPRDMGKYARDTGHLTLFEHGAYNLLLDHYYSTGGLPQVIEQCSSNATLMPDHSRVYRVCKAIGKAEQEAVDAVLKFFFKLNKHGFYVQDRCEEVIKEQTLKHQNRVRAGSQAKPKQCSSNTPQTQTKTKNNISREGAFTEVLEEGGKVSRPKLKIDHLLTDKQRALAKDAAPGWDIHHLMREFDERVNSGLFAYPDKPGAAFVGWCGSFTKGNQPR